MRSARQMEIIEQSLEKELTEIKNGNHGTMREDNQIHLFSINNFNHFLRIDWIYNRNYYFPVYTKAFIKIVQEEIQNTFQL